MTKGECENFEEMSFEEMLEISDLLEKYMALYNIIQGTRDNYSDDRKLVNKFKRCLTKGLAP